jgi:hypothetical protein
MMYVPPRICCILGKIKIYCSIVSLLHYFNGVSPKAGLMFGLKVKFFHMSEFKPLALVIGKFIYSYNILSVYFIHFIF